MRPVLLLGGGGFIGTALTQRLQRSGYTVHVVKRSDKEMLAPMLSQCGTVVHLASGTTPGSSAFQPELEQANLLLTRQLVGALQTQPDTHLVFFSSGGTVYGNPAVLPVCEDAPLAPLSPHGAAKVEQENLCLALRLRGHAVSIVRPSNAYGPGQLLKGGFGLVRTLLEHARKGTQLHIWGDGENLRDYVYVDDLVEATVRLIEQPEAAGIYNLGSGRGYSVNQVKATVEEVTGLAIGTRHGPPRGVDVRAVVLDWKRAADLLGWRPAVELSEGVARTWRWLRQSVESCS